MQGDLMPADTPFDQFGPHEPGPLLASGLSYAYVAHWVRMSFPAFAGDLPASFLTIARRRLTQSGEVVCQPDRAMPALTIIVSGKLRLDKDSHTIRHFGPRDYIGEGGLIRDNPTGVTILAVEPGELLEFPHGALRQLIGTEQGFGVALLRTLLSESMNRLQATSQLFADNRSMTQQLAQAVEQRDTALQKVKGSEELMRFLATHDPLTQLGNRTLLQERLEHMLKRAKRYGHRFALHVLDLDHFKEINDVHGHPVGDSVLVTIAERLRLATRGGDAIVRMGGDEFAVLQDLSAHDATDDAGVLAERLIIRIAAPIQAGELELAVGASIGVAIYPDDASTPEDLLRNADLALYRAKNDGRARYAFFTPTLGADAIRLGQIKSALRRAVPEGGLRVVYQPKIDLRHGDLTGMEALVRWSDPEHGHVPPSEFIPIAERSGLIGAIGAFVLREACRTTMGWRASGVAGLTVAVNLSPVQFRVQDVVGTVRAALEESGLPPDALELEVTESTLMQDADDTMRALRQLQDLGVSIAVDDFGTGYSSMTYLRQLGATTLKIDRSFVDGCAEPGEDEQIVRAVIGLAHDLNMQVVAEGVETAAQLSVLHRLRCDYAQGYLLARPLDETGLSDFILRHSITQRRVSCAIAAKPNKRGTAGRKE